jgi:dihydroorotate dehydrogenase (fumarate)
MNLTTTYLGLNLQNPIVPSSSPLSHSVDSIKRLEDAGAGAVVMYSLFEEQIEQEMHLLDHYLQHGTHSFAEALNYFPNLQTYNVEPEAYVELIRKAKASVDIPIIGSLNGTSTGGWVQYARSIEQAGADALEINMYYVPTNQDMRSDQVEQRYIDILCDVKRTVRIPVAMKLSPFFSAPAYVAKRLVQSGASGLVLFNRFYQPDLDLETLSVIPRLKLSDSDELRLPLRWVAILYGRMPVDFAISTGVHTYEDVLKGLMAGAKVTMMASELLQNGIGRIGQVLRGLQEWMEEHEYESVQQMQGSMSQLHVSQPDAFERANYMKVLDSWHSPVLRERAQAYAFDDGNFADFEFTPSAE